MIIDTPVTFHISDDFGIIIEPYCHNCIDFNPMSEDETLFINHIKCVRHMISCSNLDVCRRLYEKMKEESKK